MRIWDPKNRRGAGNPPPYPQIERIARYGLSFLLFFPFAALFLTKLLSLPHMLMYCLDAVNLGLFLLSAHRFPWREKRGRAAALYIAGLFVYTLLGCLANRQPLLYYLWGLRNTFRFFLFFLSCLCWARQEDVSGVLRVLEYLLYANVPVCGWQFWVQKLPFDSICGLFGTEAIGSSYMNVLLVLVSAWVTLRYLRRDVPLWRFALAIAAGVFIAVVSELKAYYFELALVVALALALQLLTARRLSRRLFAVVALCAAGMALLAVLTVALQPEYWSGFFLPGGVWEEVTRSSGYSASGDLNRLTAIPYLFVNIFGSGPAALIGLGLGNCDYSGAAFLTTPFYSAHQSLHYVWMHSAFLFLETGFIGLLLYMGFFVLTGGAAWKLLKRCGHDSSAALGSQLALIMSACCFFLLFYNISLRLEIAYMIFYILAFPFMDTRGGGGKLK